MILRSYSQIILRSNGLQKEKTDFLQKFKSDSVWTFFGIINTWICTIVSKPGLSSPAPEKVWKTIDSGLQDRSTELESPC